MSAVICEGVGKRYRIYHDTQHDTLRDAIAANVRRLVAGSGASWKRAHEDFWALKDVSFTLAHGDAVGIVGRNGAGKSSLLKVLSRVTTPSEGRVTLRGRVASLLEVGTGFHPELTGRENIFLNGVILGMSRREVAKRFDEIVQFAQVERFLDTPVKHFSSGMYVRLAFAVAAHLEPDILIVDEVLAVGDAAFQRKCLGKLDSVARSGRTVVFVSHNLSAVRTLCKTAILLNSGRLVAAGAVDEITKKYLALEPTSERPTLWKHNGPFPEHPHIRGIQVEPGGSIRRGETLRVVVSCNEPCKDGVIIIQIRNSEGELLLHSSDEFQPGLPPSRVRAMTLDTTHFNVGEYRVQASLAVRNVAEFHRVELGPVFALDDPDLTVAGTTASNWKGMLSPRLPTWS